MAVQNDFSKGSILSHMARIALPMTLAQFVNILYNIIFQYILENNVVLRNISNK